MQPRFPAGETLHLQMHLILTTDWFWAVLVDTQDVQAGLVGQAGQKEKQGEQQLVVVKMGKRGNKLPCQSSC